MNVEGTSDTLMRNEIPNKFDQKCKTPNVTMETFEKQNNCSMCNKSVELDMKTKDNGVVKMNALVTFSMEGKSKIHLIVNDELLKNCLVMGSDAEIELIKNIKCCCQY